jgi:hypothetical protein
MFSFIRRHFTYANLVATLALIFSMSGAALAAQHYLINSTSQINPNVLKALKGHNGRNGRNGLNGRRGPRGPQGVPGPQGFSAFEGPEGKRGPAGGSGGGGGSAADPPEPVHAALSPGSLEEQNVVLARLPGEIEIRFICARAFGHGAAGLKVFAPNGSYAESGMVVTKADTKEVGEVKPPPEHPQELIQDVSLQPKYAADSEGVVVVLQENGKEPFANAGHVDMSIVTPTTAAYLDAFIQAGPDTDNPADCTLRGTVL